MTREALRDGLISEKTIRDSLLLAKGDIFLSASYLGCTTRELDSYIRASDELQGFVAAIETVKRNPDYDRMSAERFTSELENLTRAYRVEALGVIHDLATMPFETAAMAEVKLKAAIQLRGVKDETSGGGDQLQILQELNQAYLTSAPRIRSVRVTTAQIEMG
jgi:hypothetical protein